MNKLEMPTENDNIDCHLQCIGMGTLICRAARQEGSGTTNEVNPAICFNCPAGRIYREVGCDAVFPKMYIIHSRAPPQVETLFCNIRKRSTTLDFCRTCGLKVAETTREIVSTAKTLFEAKGFYSAYQDIEEARKAIDRDQRLDCVVPDTSQARQCGSSLGSCDECLRRLSTTTRTPSCFATPSDSLRPKPDSASG